MSSHGTSPAHLAPVADPSSAKAWLAKLVSFDTTSSKTNVPLIQHVAAFAQAALKAADNAPAEHGAKVLVEYGPENNDVSYANLIISIPAFAEGDTTANFTGGYVLSGHSDCVPVDGQAWDTDPFTLVEKDGKLYGRGTCDMKGFLAVFLSLVPEWAQAMRERRFRKPLHLVLTYNEEVDMQGCHQLLMDGGEAWRRLQACEGAIIGEPTSMELIVAHKGIHQNCVTCHGFASHSSLQTASYHAMEPATRILTHLFSMRDRFSTAGPFDDSYGVPFTTFCPGQLRGGQALNTTPDLCTLAYQYRNIPQHDPNAIEDEVRALIRKENETVQAQVKAINEALAKKAGKEAPPRVTASVEHGTFVSAPHFDGDPSATIVRALQRAVVAVEARTNPGSTVGAALQKVSFYTEAGNFQKKGLKTVVCGPGNIEQAHKANEFITVEQLDKGVRVIRKVVEELCFRQQGKL